MEWKWSSDVLVNPAHYTVCVLCQSVVAGQWHKTNLKSCIRWQVCKSTQVLALKSLHSLKAFISCQNLLYVSQFSQRGADTVAYDVAQYY